MRCVEGEDGVPGCHEGGLGDGAEEGGGEAGGGEEGECCAGGFWGMWGWLGRWLKGKGAGGG